MKSDQTMQTLPNTSLEIAMRYLLTIALACACVWPLADTQDTAAQCDLVHRRPQVSPQYPGSESQIPAVIEKTAAQTPQVDEIVVLDWDKPEGIVCDQYGCRPAEEYSSDAGVCTPESCPEGGCCRSYATPDLAEPLPAAVRTPRGRERTIVKYRTRTVERQPLRGDRARRGLRAGRGVLRGAARVVTAPFRIVKRIRSRRR